MFCPKCGTPLGGDSGFCSRCGTAIGGSKPVEDNDSTPKRSKKTRAAVLVGFVVCAALAIGIWCFTQGDGDVGPIYVESKAVTTSDDVLLSEEVVSYDAEGVMKSTTITASNGSTVIRTLEITYRDDGLVDYIEHPNTNANGTVRTEYEYDERGNVACGKYYLADGSTYLLEYDTEGVPVRQSHCSSSGDVESSETWAYEYSQDNRSAVATGLSGESADRFVFYDENGMVSETRSGSIKTTFEYQRIDHPSKAARALAALKPL